MPDAGIVERPEQSADVDDDDECDDDATEELKLCVDSARLDVVARREIVSAKHYGLKDVNATDCEPAESSDDGHKQDMADIVFQAVGKMRNGWQHNENAGQEEDGSRRITEMLLESPPDAEFALLLLLTPQ